jgi:hypothetical protein
MIIFRRIFLRIRNVQDNVVVKIETHYILNNFFPKIFLRNNVEKYGTARLATDDDTIQYTCIACRITKVAHSHVICNTYCSSTARIVTRTRLNIRLYYSPCLILYICHNKMHSHIGTFFYYINCRHALITTRYSTVPFIDRNSVLH